MAAVAGIAASARLRRVSGFLDGRAQRFDPAGDYVRRYVPELAALPPGPHPHSVDPGIGYRDPLVEV